MPNAVLYVREALGLPVAKSPGVPPRLIDKVPDRSDLIQDADLTVAAAEWAAWWKAVGEFEARVQQLGGESAAQARNEYRSLVEPETAPALSGSLKAAAQTLYCECCHWVDVDPGPSRRVNGGALAGFEWNLIHDAVEEVAAQAEVNTAEIRGVVSVLFVQGTWGAVTAPGFAWCSLAAANDPRVCSEIIRAALKSRLTQSD
jgi:hypothetical protein